MIGANLLRYRDDAKIVFGDFETEGLHLARSRPWQCAFIVYHGQQKVDEYDGYPWWPDLDVNPRAAQITRFDYNKYKSKAVDPTIVRARWLRYRNDPTYIKVMHNGLGYDSMIDALWGRALGEEPDYSWLLQLLDTVCVGKAMKKGIKMDISTPEEFLACQFRLSNLVEKGLKTNLTALGKEFKIDYDYENLHDGVNDVGLNRLVLEQMKWSVEI